MRQLPLRISAPAEPRFENYLAGANVEALARVCPWMPSNVLAVLTLKALSGNRASIDTG